MGKDQGQGQGPANRHCRLLDIGLDDNDVLLQAVRRRSKEVALYIMLHIMLHEYRVSS